MQLKQSLLSCARGYTVLELMVATVVSLSLVAMAVGITTSTRQLFEYDAARIDTVQNLRSTLDLVGIHIREGGERLPSSFPAIEVVDGGGANSDELILRRNLLDEVLVVCQTITAGSSGTQIMLDNATGLPAACAAGAQASNITAWETYRADEPGDEIKAYIFDSSTKNGEFITITGTGSAGANTWMARSAGSFTHTYTGGSAAVYVIEEWNYRINGDTLELVINQDEGDIRRVATGIFAFYVQVRNQDGTVVNQLINTDNWALMEALDITVRERNLVRGKSGNLFQRQIDRTYSGRYFPRNILSN